jgi:hypothetical protein
MHCSFYVDADAVVNLVVFIGIRIANRIPMLVDQ